jgi:hypothetical protein
LISSHYNIQSTKDTWRRVLRRLDGLNLSKSLSLRLCHHLVHILCTSINSSTTVGIPPVVCRPYFVDSGTPGKGCTCWFYGKPDSPLSELDGPSRAQPVVHDRIHDLDRQRQWHRGDHGDSVESPYADRANIFENINRPRHPAARLGDPSIKMI